VPFFCSFLILFVFPFPSSFHELYYFVFLYQYHLLRSFPSDGAESSVTPPQCCQRLDLRTISNFIPHGLLSNTTLFNQLSHATNITKRPSQTYARLFQATDLAPRANISRRCPKPLSNPLPPHRRLAIIPSQKTKSLPFSHVSSLVAIWVTSQDLLIFRHSSTLPCRHTKRTRACR